MTAVAVIPARYASTRFPGKPLANDTGKFLIQHVYEQVRRCPVIQQVWVATDDKRIFDAVVSFGGECLMTRQDHATGTDRVGEVANTLGLADDTLVLNVQGDEPEISPSDLTTLITSLQQTGSKLSIGTLATPFPTDGPCDGPGSPTDPNCVKVILDHRGRAICFSRSLLPYPRSTEGRVENPAHYLLHLGVYAFRASVLRKVTTELAPGSLEQIESLEQLRWLAFGLAIGVTVVTQRVTGIDTPEDYRAFVKRFRQGRSATPANVGSRS